MLKIHRKFTGNTQETKEKVENTQEHSDLVVAREKRKQRPTLTVTEVFQTLGVSQLYYGFQWYIGLDTLQETLRLMKDSFVNLEGKVAARNLKDLCQLL